MALVLVSAPATEPVSLTEAKLHLRVDSTADDSLITALITAAREYVEAFTGRALITQTWDYILDAWPSGDEIVIPLPPLQSVTSVTYRDSDGNTSTVSSSTYTVDTDSEPGRVVLLTGYTWPSTTLYAVGGVRVRFVAGYGDNASDVPQALRQAMLLLVGHWYENREDATTANVRPIPLGAQMLMWPYRVMRWP